MGRTGISWTYSKESLDGAGRADPGGMAGPGLTQTEMVSDLWSDGIISNILNIAKTPNAKKALFLTAILLGTPVAAALLTSCDDGNTKPETPQPEKYEAVDIPNTWSDWMKSLFVIKKEKGIDLTPEALSFLRGTLGSARVASPTVKNYFDKCIEENKKLVLLIDNSSANASISTDGFHIPLALIIQSGSALMSELIDLITTLDSGVSQSKQFAQSVAAQAKASFFANSKTARQQAALLAKYTARSNVRHA
jgi:hypothetical protein